MADLLYEPDAGAAGRLIGLREPKRLLILGPALTFDDDELDRNVDARRLEPPGPVMADGVYSFRSTDGWDLLVSSGGLPPGAPQSTALGEAAPNDPLLSARAWFEHFWVQALPAGRRAIFAVGDAVRVAGGGPAGRVEAVTRVDDDWVYRVAVGNAVQTISEAGLEPDDVDRGDWATWIQDGPASVEQLAATLTFTKLNEKLTDTVYSYLSSRTVYRPYQLRPVLRMLNSPHQRLLIADEVGLGKTIEAGLIWVELEQRADLRRVLVVCPAPLVQKWKAEMRHRFDRDLEVLDASGLARLVETVRLGDEQKSIHAIVSLERLRANKVLADLVDLQPRFDLVIVDEAHYLRGGTTRSAQLGRHLSDWADSLIFLSATPLNLGNRDLYNLLNILVEEEFSDPDVFQKQLEPNRYLNAAAAAVRDRAPRAALQQVERAALCELGGSVAARPEYSSAVGLLRGRDTLTVAEVAHLRRLLSELNTLSSVLTRTRKVDVPDAKAVREPRQIDVAWTEQERLLYEAVVAWARRRAQANGGVPGWSTQMPLRQAASCLPVMCERVRQQDPDLFRPSADRDDFDDDLGSVDWWEQESAVPSPAEIAELIAGYDGTDTKLEAFRAALRHARERGMSQALVFSFFRGTLDYLQAQLEGEFSVRTMHGGTHMRDRAELIDRFRQGEFDILLCSEVGSEGLDFEFCNVLVNYDLPWNPMKVEQRIGRLDRFGQQHEKIAIYNFHVPGTIETDIFERLYTRIGVFEDSIGELEPILRDELNSLTGVAFDPELSPAQRQQRADEIAVAAENKRQHLAEIEAANAMLSGVDQLLIEGLNETIDRGRFVGSRELQIFLDHAFRGTGSRLRAARGGLPSELVGDATVADWVARVPPVVGGSRFPVPELVRRLRDEEPIIVTFENDEASGRNVDLISIRHPVVRGVVRQLKRQSEWLRRYGWVHLTEAAPAVDAVVVVHLAETSGLRPSLELWPVAVPLDASTDPEVVADLGDRLLGALANGQLTEADPLDSAAVHRAAARAAEMVLRLQLDREETRRKENVAMVEARIAAQRAGFDLKIERARHTLALVRRESRAKAVQRLHEGRIANLERRRDEVAEELTAKRALAVGVRPIAVIGVRSGTKPVSRRVRTRRMEVGRVDGE